eukprot:1143737-Pelagomonas_calceolata.AAC.2
MQILKNWYPSKDELDTKGAILVMTSGREKQQRCACVVSLTCRATQILLGTKRKKKACKEGAVSGGDSFMNAVGEELLDSIVGDQIPIYTEQEKYNLTVESTVDRIAAKLEGKEVPGVVMDEGKYGGESVDCVASKREGEEVSEWSMTDRIAAKLEGGSSADEYAPA